MDARRQGGGRLGRGLHRGGGDPPHVGRQSLHRAPALGRPRHPDARADRRPDPRVRRAGGDRARSQRPARRQPLRARGASGGLGDAGRRLGLGAATGPRHGQAGHPRPPPLAPGCGAQGAAGRVRPRLRLRRARAQHPAPLPLPPSQPAERRVRRPSAQPRTPARRDHRRHQGCRGRHLRRALPDRRRRAAGRGRPGEGGGGGADRPHRRAAGPLGPVAGSLAQRFHDVAVRRRRLAGALRRGREVAHHEAGRRRRALHLARPHGVGGQQGDRRLHRLRPALHRRPVPAEEDRGGAPRRHSRVHRLQHLRLGRLHHVADSLHPEPDHERRVAQGLAPGAHPATRIGEARPNRGRGPGGPRGGAGARQAGLRGDAGGERHRAWRPRRPRMPAAGARRLGPGPRLP